MQNRVTLFMTLAIVCLSLLGCRSARYSGIITESHSQGNIQAGYQMVDKRIVIVGSSSHIRNGLLNVIIQAKNLTSIDLPCEYKYTWYDADGICVETGMSIWKPICFNGETQSDMSAVAPNKRVKHYKLALRFTKYR